MEIKNILIKKEYILREFGGEFNVFHTEDEAGAVVSMNSLNELGCFLWLKLKEKTSLQDMVEAVMLRNDIDEEDARMEVEELLAKLLHAGVVEIEKEK